MTQSSRILRVWAHLTAHSRAFSTVLVAVLILGAVYAILARPGFEFNPLGLLPAGDPEVEALKYYELSFDSSDLSVFWCRSAPAEVAAGERFVRYLAGALEKETWVRRVLNRDPRTTVTGRQEAERIVPWLLLNRPAAEFRDALERLEPNILQQQLLHFREKNQSGAEDPMQLRSLSHIGLEPLYSADAVRLPISPELRPGIRLIYIEAADAMNGGKPWLRQLNGFVRKAEKNWTGYRPEIRVLSRSSILAETSAKNWQNVGVGILVACLGSGCLLAFGYRRCSLGLTGFIISLLVLLLSAGLFGLRLGRFDDLSLGFAPILAGLVAGQTAVMYSLHRITSGIAGSPVTALQLAMASGGNAVWLVAGSTALGLVWLLLAAPPVFAFFIYQLLLGLLLGAPLSILLSLAWIRQSSVPANSKPQKANGARLGGKWVVLLGGITLAAGMVLSALHFKRPIRFVTATKFFGPTAWFEPFRETLRSAGSSEAILLAQAPGGAAKSADWETIESELRRATVAGQIAGFSSPAAFFWSTQRRLENRAFLLHYDFPAIRVSFENELQASGLDLDDFRVERDLLSSLAQISRDPNPPDWSHLFPPNSGWNLLLNRYVSADRNLGVCFIELKPGSPRRLDTLLAEIDPSVQLLVWPTLFSHLKFDASVRCALAGGLAGLGILVFLWLAYRDWCLLGWHAASLAVGMGLLLCGLAAGHAALDLYGLLAIPAAVSFSAGCGAAFVYLRCRFPQERPDRLIWPIVMMASCAILGFGALALRQHSVWRTLGIVGAGGISAELLVLLIFFLPAVEQFRLCERQRG